MFDNRWQKFNFPKFNFHDFVNVQHNASVIIVEFARTIPFRIFLVLHSLYCELVPAWVRPRFRMSEDCLRKLVEMHVKWLNGEGNGARLVLFAKNLGGLDLTDYNLSKAIIRNCDLRRCRFSHVKSRMKDDRETEQRQYHSHLVETDFSYGRLEQSVFGITRPWGQYLIFNQPDLTGARFVGCTGLFGAESAFFGREIYFDPTNPPKFQRWFPGSSVGDFPSWTLTQSFQRLRILGISNTFATFIVLYAVIAAWYNNFILKIQQKMAGFQIKDGIVEIVGSLRPLPIPEHFGKILVVIAMLFVANILYTYLEPYKDGSRRVIDAYSPGDDGTFRTLSARYDSLLGRWVCFCLLSYCVLYLIQYFVRRIIDAFIVYFPNGFSFSILLDWSA